MTAPERTRLGGSAAMAIVRIGMVLGALALGGIVWLLYRNGRPPLAIDRPRLRLYRDVAMVVWIVASIALATVALRRQRVLDERRERVYTLVAWSIGEAVAVLGGLLYLLSDLARFYTLGLLFLVVALVISPIRQTE